MPSQLEKKALKFIEQNKLISENDKILVAFSGGPDSVALLFYLNKISPLFNLKLAALYIDHNLRTEAKEEIKFCESFCDMLQIPFYFESANVKDFAATNKYSIEEAGRILRYRILKEFLKKINYDKIATAHHKNDNAETILLNFLKGAGLKSLSGIKPKRNKIIRPFLCVEKKEILDYIKENNLNFAIDISNYDEKYQRNFIRNALLPLISEKLNPSIVNTLYKNSQIFYNAHRFLMKEALKIIDKYFKIDIDKEKIIFFCNDLEMINKTILGEALKFVIFKVYKLNFRFEIVEKVLSLTSKQVGKKVYLGDNLVAIKERNCILIEHNKKIENSLEYSLYPNMEMTVDHNIIKIKLANNENIDLINKQRTIELIDADKIIFPLKLRRWKSGDKFIPLGMSNFKKISDFLTDIKVPASLKKEIYVLCNKKDIICVLGYRIDERYKITKETKKILEIYWETIT